VFNDIPFEKDIPLPSDNKSKLIEELFSSSDTKYTPK